MREKTTTKKSKQSDVALKVEHVSKSFHLPTEQSNSIKQVFINRMRGIKGYKKQEVLKDISFEVKKGDFFGIVGRNGSGKSTLLKLISEIYTPDSGKITVNGSLVPFIELGVGFNPELTGRENVYLNGAMLGFSRSEIDDMYDDIVEFAELPDFMDQKLKNYSSGMQVRLAFSVAIKAQGDILVLDEVLAVGDEAFQRKCDKFFEEVKKDRTKTVVLVTHSMSAVRRYCNRAMMIHEGEVITLGSSEDVANEYSLENFNNSSIVDDSKNSEKEESIIKDLRVVLKSPAKVNQNDKVTVEYAVKAREDIEASIVTDLYNMDDNYCLYCFGSPKKQLRAGELTHFEATFDISLFNDMNVIVHTSVRDKDNNRLAFSSDADSPQLMIRRNDYTNNKEPQAGAIFKNGKNAVWR